MCDSKGYQSPLSPFLVGLEDLSCNSVAQASSSFKVISHSIPHQKTSNNRYAICIHSGDSVQVIAVPVCVCLCVGM